MKNRYLIVLLAIVMLMTSSFATLANADEMEEVSFRTIYAEALNEAFEEIVQRIIARYGYLYQLDNFSYEVIAERIVDGIVYVDIDIYAYMTLTRHPRYNPYVLGLQEFLLNERSELNRSIIQHEIESFVSNTEVFYNDPFLTTFSHTITFPLLRATSSISCYGYTIFHRCSGNGEIILTLDTGNVNTIEDFDAIFESGTLFAESLIQNALSAPIVPLNFQDVRFNPNGAVHWARTNAYNTQEIPNSVVPGSNCANFVSFAINAGGIPTSTTWRPAPVWGASWPSDNWIRTGFHNNGGVTTHLTNQLFFFSSTSRQQAIPGSILFWTSQSHVALIVRNDGTNIWFADNGAQQRSNALWNQSSTPARFYVPQPWVLGLPGPLPW